MRKLPINTAAMDKSPPPSAIDVVVPASSGKKEGEVGYVSHRPWGTFECLARGQGFQVKCITVKPGQRLSLQFHRHRSEHWTIVRGRAHIVLGESTRLMDPDQSVYIPLGALHRIENQGEETVELIEVQFGSYLGEDDIVRLEDVYGRE